MSIKQLIDILEPPVSPVESKANNDWGSITSRFNMPLPTDYMQFIDKYGSGEIGGWLTVFNPFSKNQNICLIDQLLYLLSGLRILKEKYPEICPYPLMFEPAGILPWGISIDGDIYCWQTAGASGKWKVIIIGRHSEPEEVDLTFSSFLSKAILGELESNTIPVEWKSEKVEFNNK